MKFVVSSSVLQKQLSVLNGVVPSNPIVPILENFLFVIEDNKLTATASDLQVFITTVVNIEATGNVRVAVPAKILLDTLRSLPDQPISIEIDEENYTVCITSYTGRYKLSGLSAEDYPQPPSVKGSYALTTECGIISKAISNTLFAVSTDELRPSMTGVFFKLASQEAVFVSTDGHKLVKYTHKGLQSKTESGVIIPKKALALLKAALPNDDTELRIDFNSSNIFFKFGEVSLVCRLIDEKYPDYESAIPHHNDKRVRIDRNEFLSSLKRLSIYANKITNQIRLKIESDVLTIFAEDLDYANEAQESLNCEGENMVSVPRAGLEDEEPKPYFEIGFNAKFLIDMLSILNCPQVEMTFSTPNKAAVLVPAGEIGEEEQILMLIMPVLLNANRYAY
ncbi:MAG: DNA polymerase III subunit beta [Microscillaceae bacterium]|nr:DNA polymerase III subunit beta [Microscillaceae bacterium]MDW8460413.1 DNA polymerase III subunit beta [Cytophagales bacterium]